MERIVLSRVSSYLGLDMSVVMRMANAAPYAYKRYYIEKKNGLGRREICHPSARTKALQYAIIDTFLSQLPVHWCAVAYKKKCISPLRKNAHIHAKKRYTVRLDIRDFFPSIRPVDLFSTDTVAGLRLGDQDTQFLVKALFVASPDGERRLAIGAPSSPIVSNIVMHNIDLQVRDYARERSAVYTRYADDILFSTDTRGQCFEFAKWFRMLLAETKSPCLKVHDTKTRFMSRGTRRVVTGLFVGPDGGISIGRENKRHVRKLLKDLEFGTITPRDRSYLQGYLAFILDVERPFYARLQCKYGALLMESALNYRSPGRI